MVHNGLIKVRLVSILFDNIGDGKLLVFIHVSVNGEIR